MAWKRCRVVPAAGLVCAALAIVAAPRIAFSQAATQAQTDWFQWRGPQRNGISAEKGWLTAWPEGGPKKLWKKAIGSGYSAVAVSRGRVYAMGSDGRNDTVWCLNAETGEEIWKQSYPCAKVDHPGPRATPTVDGKSVYTFSQEGHVNCFDADTGRPVWSKNVRQELRLGPADWGFASSPLVEGNLLILNAGSAGLALDKASGNVVWNSGPGKPGYASAVPFDMQKRRCLLVFVAEGLICVDAGSGERIWSVPWKTDYDVHAADPIVSGDRIFISSGYGNGCALIKVEDGKPTVAWRNREMKNHFSACVLREGYLYGADGNDGQAVVKCMELQTGQVKWAGPRLGMASLMLADGKLIIQGDGGRLIVAQATPEKFTPLADAKVHAGQCWTMPVLSGGRIYCRDSGVGKPGELVCLDVRAR